MKCPSCFTNDAIQSPTYGVVACLDCQQKPYWKTVNPELTTESIKDQRKAFGDDLIQPFREGRVSKEYLDKFGSKYIDVTEEEVKNAKNVWGDQHYYATE